MLLWTLASGKVDAKKLITHHFRLDDILGAYDTFSRAASTHALKVIIEMQTEEENVRRSGQSSAEGLVEDGVDLVTWTGLSLHIALCHIMMRSVCGNCSPL
ncbi:MULTISPECIES: hypothetical protein [Agrobacterium]|uniref:hypothetical protein n=1 Tax=Agrobacterium TaxID=357 RepID=UPI00277E4078|nr:hypothetical protein [Agrobacterium sp. SORGH_AS_0745]MDP9759263.1 hypothetical protein [Agrobacterium tumefaciens]MDQ1223690.1 hypothetical protein [Agrobacterium sp. SORGH_AS_0745]